MSGGTDTCCNYFWGSHGCDLPADHQPPTLHRCGTRDPEGECCEYDAAADPDHRVRHLYADPADWSDWGPYSEGYYAEAWWRK